MPSKIRSLHLGWLHFHENRENKSMWAATFLQLQSLFGSSIGQFSTFSTFHQFSTWIGWLL